jgi:hypothetical protein
MFNKLVPIQKDSHKNVKINPIDSFSFASKFHIASVSVNEYARAAACYPIVFVKGPENQGFRSVALFSTTEGENAFVDSEGKWDAPYVPAILRRYPFAVAPINQDAEKPSYAICIDEESPVYSETEGRALFNEDGTESEYFNTVRDFLTDVQKHDVLTNGFCELLDKHGLLVEQSLDITAPDGKKKRIGGFHLIDEKKFRDLPDQVFLELRHRGALDGIYAQLCSLGQIQALAKKTFDAASK